MQHAHLNHRYESSYINGGSRNSFTDPLFGSFSKDKKFGIVEDNCEGTGLDICPDILLAGLALAGAGAFAALVTAITMAGRKKKRSAGVFQPLSPTDTLQDLIWLGSYPCAFYGLLFVLILNHDSLEDSEDLEYFALVYQCRSVWFSCSNFCF